MSQVGASCKVDTGEDGGAIKDNADPTGQDGLSGAGICWGANTESQQGIGNNSNQPFAVVPTLIQGPSGESMTSISATTAQACAMYDQTGAHCWGDNWGGNTGDYDGSNAVLCNYSGQENGGGNVNCQDRAEPHQVHTGGNYAAVVMLSLIHI